MIRLLSVLIVATALSACGPQTYHTVEVKQPRYHKGWYKNHRWHTRLRVGRIHIRWFEKQGTKSVKMKG